MNGGQVRHTHLGELGQIGIGSSFTRTATVTTVTTQPTISKEAPPVHITTKVVEVIDGFLGQLVHEGKVIWQSSPKRDYDKAATAATRRKNKAIRGLFGDAD